MMASARAHSAYVRNIPPTYRGDKKTTLHGVPPNSNTGERSHLLSSANQPEDKCIALIDYLTFVLPANDFYKQLQVPDRDNTLSLHNFALKVEREILNMLNLCLDLTKKGGRNGYKHSWNIVDNSNNDCGFVAFGENKNKQGHETICINIAGQGTACIGSFGYEQLYKLMVEKGAHITRIDLAHDCHNGEVTLIEVQNWYDAGLFRASARGKYPTASKWDDLGSGNGFIFYVGSRESGKLFRAYEKGKQLGDKNSKWLRLEIELRSKKRTIPLDILLDTASYISGCYQCMQFLNIEQSYIETHKNTTAISYKHLEEYCRQSYGRFIDLMFSVYDTPEDVTQALRRNDGLPRRLNLITVPVLE